VGVIRYRKVADMPPPGRRNPSDPRTYARIKDLWRFCSRCLPALFESGVYRYRSIEDSQSARERATIERMRALRDSRAKRGHRRG
jgi:hypothetical protein